MMRCLRIFGAYSYRLTRRHSTVLLIAAFILTLTVILQLYMYRRQDHPHTLSKIGDFDYRPGLFLRGHQPNVNRTYCEFNYGLPETLKWERLQMHSTPEIGNKSPYRVIYNAIKGTMYTNYSKHDYVTYATQATPEYLYHIIEIARYWDGPISLAVFVPSYDLDITMQILVQLCHCYHGMAKVSVHLFYPKRHPPVLRTKEQITMLTTEAPVPTTNLTMVEVLKMKVENYRKMNNADNKTRAEYIQKVRLNKIERMMMKMPIRKSVAPDIIFNDCSEPDTDLSTFRHDHNIIYPINVGRNVARNASTTNYFLVSDIEMVPSDGLATKFVTMLRKLMGDKKRAEGCVFAKTVFVVPLFETEQGEEIPRDKESLVALIAANRAMYFHQKFCAHCQRFPGLHTWLLRPSPNVVEPMLIARREYPFHRWEPLYFGTQKEPWYSEMLSWEGKQDKMTQMLELCLQQYRLVVLDGGFLCHAAAVKNNNRNTRAERMNDQKYMKILERLRKKYGSRDQCKIH